LEDKIKMNLTEGGYKVVNSTGLAKDRIQYQGFVKIMLSYFRSHNGIS
jgi:hypothetical protein